MTGLRATRKRVCQHGPHNRIRGGHGTSNRGSPPQTCRGDRPRREKERPLPLRTSRRREQAHKLNSCESAPNTSCSSDRILLDLVLLQITKEAKHLCGHNRSTSFAIAFINILEKSGGGLFRGRNERLGRALVNPSTIGSRTAGQPTLKPKAITRIGIKQNNLSEAH